jgi:class 3 adenylate cyclase
MQGHAGHVGCSRATPRKGFSDRLLVYSGYPVAHDNDAERAVRQDRIGHPDAMQTLNERLEQEKGIRLGARVGIRTGPVVAGDVGAGARHEHLAVGEVPNVAARLQGQYAIGDETCPDAGDSIDGRGKEGNGEGDEPEPLREFKHWMHSQPGYPLQ